MNRTHMALLTSMLLGSQAWAQPTPAPVRNIPLSTDTAPFDSVPIETAPAGPTGTAPTGTMPSSSNFDDANDSCGCSGCCNLAHPWRSLKGTAGSGSSCACETACGPPGRVWFGVDVLYWRIAGDPLPALVTTSPSDPLTPVATAGVLPAATVLLGQQNFNNDPRGGLRINMGGWFNDAHTVGLQIGAFQLLDHSATTTLASDGTPILARPFFNVQTNANASQIVAYPNAVSSGSVGVSERNTLQGLDLAFRGLVCCGESWRLDALLGYRFLRFTEQLLIQERLVAGANAQAAIGLPPGTVVDSFDRFDTGNEYHALQVGFAGEIKPWDKLSFSGTAKASFGVMDQGVGIDGATRFSTDGVTRVGGLLALNSNIGAYRRSDTALIPELTLNANYQWNDRVRLRFGYDLLYLSNVQRPGAVIDTSIDPRRIPPITNPTINRPVFGSDGNATNLMIQGIHAGVEIRF